MKTETAPGLTRLTMSKREKMHRVLIVDDDEVFGNILGNIVAISGYVPEIVHNAGNAMDCLTNEEGCFDLVITDYEMPKMNGIEFTRIAKKRFPGLLITGMSGNAFIRDDFIDAGANVFLQKPFRAEQILNLIALISQKAFQS